MKCAVQWVVNGASGVDGPRARRLAETDREVGSVCTQKCHLVAVKNAVETHRKYKFATVFAVHLTALGLIGMSGPNVHNCVEVAYKLGKEV